MFKLTTKKVIFLVLVVVVAVIGTRLIASRNGNGDVVVQDNIREVELASVAELSQDKLPLPLLGKVRSISEAEIRTQAQGEVLAVYKELGDSVTAGTVIAEIENSSESAALIQAEGAVDAAQANLLKIKKGTRDEDLAILEAQKLNAEQLLKEARTSAANAIRDSFVSADDGIRNKIDQFFISPRSTGPDLKFSSDPVLENKLIFGRQIVESALTNWRDSINNLNSGQDLTPYIEEAEGNLDIIRSFLNDAALAVNQLIPNSELSQGTIDGWRAGVSAARSSISGSISALSAIKDNLNGKTTGLEIAEKRLESGSTGGTQEDIAAAEAALKQAGGALALARANFEKTIVRSPISGTINTLDIDRGDFVSRFEPAVKVSNNNALEIIAFITENDLNDVEVGSLALIDNRWKGVVTAVAPALNIQNKKIEVKIGVSEETTLTNGQSVRLTINRTSIEKTLDELLIPISALKIISGDNIVFTVNPDSTLSPNPVDIGSIVGDKVVVNRGLTASLFIVLDARGLKEGQVVSVK